MENSQTSATHRKTISNGPEISRQWQTPMRVIVPEISEHPETTTAMSPPSQFAAQSEQSVEAPPQQQPARWNPPGISRNSHRRRFRN